METLLVGGPIRGKIWVADLVAALALALLVFWFAKGPTWERALIRRRPRLERIVPLALLFCGWLLFVTCVLWLVNPVCVFLIWGWLL